MNTAEQAYESILLAIENNRLSEALDQLLALAAAYSPSREAAVRMQRSEFNALEEESLMMGDGSSIRERRSSLKLQLFRLADAIKKDVQAAPTTPPAFSDRPKRQYDTTALRALFRLGQPGPLIRQLITLTDGDRVFYDQALLLEQRWKAVSDDEQHHTASLESITVRKNQLNKDLLELIREMEGV